MTEQTTIAPCPVCGSAATGQHGLTAACLTCQFHTHIDAWSRLSRAAALLRAVEGLDSAMDGDGAALISKEMVYIWLPAPTASVQPGPLADALIALASEVER